ncbi:MAG: aldose epimerase [Opitutaceae bacterium]|jgi:galactose mutarotase-like enzyme|nr:aldose epimerase [Opitutaceae bacterium]
MEKIAYQGQTLTRWQVGNSTFLALPERGARLMNWNLRLGDGSVRDVIYWPENADFGEIAKVRGGNPILFPFNGRCFDRGDIFHWRAPDGVRRPMPLHGIARQGDFKVTRLDARGFDAVLVPGDEARACYPYDYEFVVAYRFEPLGLSCEFSLTNLGAEPLPWSAGHHFYFTLPWTEGTSRSDYSIRIPATKRLRHDPTGALVQGPELGDKETFGNASLVDCIHGGLRSHEAVFSEEGRTGSITVRLGTDPVPPPEAVFVTWTLAETSPFFCVEPWMGPPNAPETKTGLHWVKKGETRKFSVSVNLR